MAELTTERRKKLPASKFALPGRDGYPVDTRARAANAKARATQMVNKGKLSASAKAQVFAKANKVLNKGKKDNPGSRRPVAGNLQQLMSGR
jgi:hypothetical protein